MNTAVRVILTASTPHGFLAATRTSTMEAKSQRPKEREGAILELDAAIEALNHAKELSSITPAKTVFGFVSVILATIKVSRLMFFLVNLM